MQDDHPVLPEKQTPTQIAESFTGGVEAPPYDWGGDTGSGITDTTSAQSAGEAAMDLGGGNSALDEVKEPDQDLTETPPTTPNRVPVASASERLRPPWSKRIRVGIAIAAFVGSGTAAWLLTSNPGDAQAPTLGSRPQATAGPAPTPEAVTSPAVTSPDSTVVEATPVPDKTSTTSVAPKSHEVETSAENTSLKRLTESELASITEITGLENLSAYKDRLRIAPEFTASGDLVKVLVLDNAEHPGQSALASDIEIAEEIASYGGNLTIPDLKLGPDVSMDVKFNVINQGNLESSRDTRYFLFTPSDFDISTLATGAAAFKEGYTISRPYKNKFFTVIRNQEDGIDTRTLTLHEAIMQSTGYDLDSETESYIDLNRPDMSYVSDSSDLQGQKQDLLLRVRETGVLSLSLACDSASKGLSYGSHLNRVNNTPFPSELGYGEEAQLKYIAPPEDLYDFLVSSLN